MPRVAKKATRISLLIQKVDINPKAIHNISAPRSIGLVRAKNNDKIIPEPKKMLRIEGKK